MLRFLRRALLGLALLSCVPALAQDLTLDPASNYLISAQINGQPVRLRVDPATPGYITLNPAAVARIGLRRSMTRARTDVGPIRLTGSTKVASVSIAGATRDRRILWWDRAVVEGADGLISPADIPYDRVTFLLSDEQPGEATFELPLRYEPTGGLFHHLQIGEQRLTILVSLHRPLTMATAAAGALLSDLQGGSWTAEAREQPVSFGVLRPARPLALTRPFTIAGLPLGQLLVRTQDHRGNMQLPSDAGADPDEIVVTAATGRQRPRYLMHLGRDWLSLCSRISLDNRTRILTMSCRAAPAAT